jgi:hypothetical protein
MNLFFETSPGAGIFRGGEGGAGATAGGGGKGGTLRSLHNMLELYPQCPEGLALYSGPYSERAEQRLRFCGCISRGRLRRMLVRMDERPVHNMTYAPAVVTSSTLVYSLVQVGVPAIILARVFS